MWVLLHSTMLLLIRQQDHIRRYVDLFYIPLCFYLYELGSAITEVENVVFTFHYASTYTRRSDSQSDRQRFYIPLCFYLYWMDTLTAYGMAILHSTMLLLIRRVISDTWGLVWFYIPLCFYLYRIHPVVHEHHIFFTFHYASTYTRRKRIRAALCKILHSTMLLLILANPHADAGAGVFTFHYASTYTKQKPKKPDYEAILHSTMLLLIRSKQNRNIVMLFFYIPLCFYLYHNRNACHKDCIFLHSTMLLLIR